ncbi:MAG: hypothetical protein ACTHMP_17185, partial [Thermomicrobiales bacterium]
MRNAERGKRNGGHGAGLNPLPDCPPARLPDSMQRVVFGDNLPVLRGLPSELANLIYIDPPFNTGHRQARTRLRTERAADGDRAGFGGHRYRTTRLGAAAY